MPEELTGEWSKYLQEREKSMDYKDIRSMLTMNQNYFSYPKQLHLDVINKHVKRNVPLNNAEFEHQLYSYQMKPILLALRIFGVFPVELLSDVPRFRLLSPVMAFSVCYYIVITISTYLIFYKVAPDLFSQEHDFLSLMILISMILAIGMCLSTPLLCWLDIKRTVRYMENWIEFQASFLKVTNEHLTLSIRRRCTINVATSLLTGVALTYFGSYLPYANLWEFPSFYTFVALCTCLRAYLMNDLLALAVAGRALANTFKNDLKRNVLTAKMIEEYRLLWLQLSQLVSDSGCAMGKAKLMNGISFFCLTSISLYVSLILDIKEMTIKKIAMATVTTAGIFRLYSICNAADNVTYCVKKIIQKELQLIRISSESHGVGEAVNIFLQTIQLSPPVISTLGFVDVNRELFTAYASATVTYMVILLQFDMGQQPDKCGKNIIRNCTM